MRQSLETSLMIRSTVRGMIRSQKLRWAPPFVLLLGCATTTGAPPTPADTDATTTPRHPREAGAAKDASDPPIGPPSYAPTFIALYEEVLLPTCGSPFCHGADGYYTLATREQGYATLVNAPATSKDCAPLGLLRVAPGHPEESLLYLKVTTPPCGARMPRVLGGSAELDPRQIAQIRRWIELGAPYDALPEAGAPVSSDAARVPLDARDAITDAESADSGG